MERTPITGYDNGYEYNVKNKKQGLSVALLGKLNKLHLSTDDANILKIIQKKSHESNIVNDFVIKKEIVEKLINLIILRILLKLPLVLLFVRVEDPLK